MAVRRRSRRRPLTEFANRSPLHALAVWLFRSALIAAMFLATYLFVMDVAVPMLTDGFLKEVAP